MTYLPWREAWTRALYGPDGFYRRNLPADHFRTASQAGADLVARALLGLLDRHGLERVVEVGAGSGTLLTELLGLRGGLRLAGVEVRPRPAGLPDEIDWYTEFPALDETPTLLLGWELLDVVPVAVAARDAAGGWRELLVRPDGSQRLGDAVSAEDRRWLERWAPAGTDEPVEVGLARERFWAGLVSRVPRGIALAVDYGFEQRQSFSLTGFRGGRQVPPRPDGSCDLTSHVRWDSLGAHLDEIPHLESELLTQRDALRAFGIAEPAVNPAQAVENPAEYLQALAARGRYRELAGPGGLGGFGWLLTVIHGQAGPVEPGG